MEKLGFRELERESEIGEWKKKEREREEKYGEICLCRRFDATTVW